MARESQGLQIALIVFVILTILLGVMTFLFYRQGEEAAINLAKAKEEATTANNSARNAQNESNRLKEMIGFGPSDEMTAIDAGFDEDMTTYMGSYDESARNYREALRHLQSTLDERNDSYDRQTAELAALKEHNERREEAKAPQIQSAEKRAQDAETQLAQETSEFQATLKANLQKMEEYKNARDEAQEKAAAVQASAEEKTQQARKRIDELAGHLDLANRKIEDLKPSTIEMADGTIRWVNQRAGTVWIDRGRADALRRQITFAVYPADITDVTRAGPKGSIEVTQILGDHLAEALILDDTVTDPILPGDAIHSTVWTPGEKEHFALGDGLDIDEDGQSDWKTVQELILANGGVVDFILNDEGQKTGEITTATNYLVLGTDPDENSPAARIDAHSAMIGKAKELGIVTIPLKDLLQRMGYKRESRVVRFGAEANPADFKAKPPGDVPKVSPGAVSPLFENRHPPRGGTRSAY